MMGSMFSSVASFKMLAHFLKIRQNRSLNNPGKAISGALCILILDIVGLKKKTSLV
jgi:hypothetical protein